jgi:hypothetical protein
MSVRRQPIHAAAYASIEAFIQALPSADNWSVRSLLLSDENASVSNNGRQ